MENRNQDFVRAVHNELITIHCNGYRKLLEETAPGDATDPYWQRALRFYAMLDEAGKQALLSIIRQTMVDTVSSLFGLLDGNRQLREVSGELSLGISGERIDGDLQDKFLEIEEQGPRFE